MKPYFESRNTVQEKLEVAVKRFIQKCKKKKKMHEDFF